jgi:hypothetical protein
MAALLDAAVAIRNLYMPESVMVSRLNLTCQVVAAYVPSSLILQHSLGILKIRINGPPTIVAFTQVQGFLKLGSLSYNSTTVENP